MPENEFDIQEKETKQYISVKIGEEKFGIDIAIHIAIVIIIPVLIRLTRLRRSCCCLANSLSFESICVPRYDWFCFLLLFYHIFISCKDKKIPQKFKS